MEHIKKFTKLIALLSIAGMFALAAPAHALISASGESKISGQVKIEDSEDDEIKGDMESRGSFDIDVDENEDEDRNEVTTEEKMEIKGEIEDDDEEMGPIVVSRIKAMKEDSISGPSDPASVSNRSDLENYLTVAAQSDEDFREARADKNEVSVRYKEHAKLFGFIPMMVTAKAVADTEGNVRVRFPWYRFLMAVDHDEIESSIQARVNSVLLGNGAQNTEAEFSTDTQARLITEMWQAFRDSVQQIKVNAQ
jgi:hypothetical protein